MLEQLHRALTLRERLAGLPPTTDGTSDDTLVGTWLERSRLATESNLERKLRPLGISRSQFAALLREPTSSLSARIGGVSWMAEITHAYADMDSGLFPYPALFTERPDAGLIVALDPLLRRAWRRFRDAGHALIARTGTKLFDIDLMAQLAADWPAELHEIFLRAFIVELNQAGEAGRLAGDDDRARFLSFVEQLRSRDTALALLGRHPVLARQAVERLQLRAEASLDMLERLVSDWPALREILGRDAAAAGMLTAVESNLGDSHRGGRAVGRLRFAGGLRLLYKPRPSGIEARFQELLAWLNDRGLTVPYRVLRSLSRERYGWVEHVTAEPCSDRGQVERFFRRQGGYVALLYAFQGSDVHYGNVIAAGEHPVLIDLESLCAPDTDAPNEAVRVQWGDLTESVLRSGILPSRTWNDQHSPGVDISGMGDPGGTPVVRPVPVVEDAGTSRMRVVRRELRWESGLNCPHLDGQRAEPNDYAAEIEAGFLEVYDILMAHRETLLAPDAIVDRCGADEVRCVLQPTSLYSVMLMESRHPSLTQSALRRECFLDRLFYNADKEPFLVEIEAGARRALERGDIPVYTTVANSRDLLVEGEVIRNFFPRSGVELVRRRLGQLNAVDRERQRTLLRHALVTSSIKGREFPMASYSPPEPVEPSRERLIAAARRVGDRLSELATRGERLASWRGVTVDRHQRWQLAPVEMDLYGGLAGITLFLGYLGDVTDEPRYGELAAAGLALALERAGQPGDASPLHGIGGLAGLVYAMAHLASMWERSDLMRAVAPLAKRIIDDIDHTEECDITAGLAGDIHCLAALYSLNSSAELRAGIAKAARRLVSLVQPLSVGVGWRSSSDEVPLTGAAHGAAGIAWALIRAAALTNDRSLVATAAQGLAFERHHRLPDTGNWRDLRPDTAAPESMVAWCHGAAGVGLTRLAMLDMVRAAPMREELQSAITTTLEHGVGHNHCLCHGDMGNLELVFSALLREENPELRAAFDAQLGSVLASLETASPLSGAPKGVESCGLFNGLAGTGFALLRFAAPDLVPSVLMLESGRADFTSQYAHSITNRRAAQSQPVRSVARSWESSFQAGYDFLRRAQRHDGVFRDFLMPPGFSTVWMTAHVPFVLDGVTPLEPLADRAAEYLYELAVTHGGPIWGYNRFSSSDNDSTTQALWLLKRRGLPIPPDWIAPLLAAQNSDGGFSTYSPLPRQTVESSGWYRSHADVTVVIAETLRILEVDGTRHERAVAWLRSQLVDGILPSYWWVTHGYALWAQARTGIVCDRVAEQSLRLLREPQRTPELGHLVFAALRTGAPPASLDGALDSLVAQQRADGSWGSAPCMRLTEESEHVSRLDGKGKAYPAVSGVFATAHAVVALAERLR